MIERYTRAKMKRIWDEQNKFQAWLDVELAAVKAWEDFGRIPKGTYDRIRKKAKFTVKGIEEIEKVTNHDVIAFTTDVASYVGEDSKWIHLGLTSSDVVDTAQALILREATDEVIVGAMAVKDVLKDLALKHKDTMMMGRTHGMHAEPTTFGAKAAVWYAEMVRNIERLKSARKEIAVGKLSGAVGNFAHCPPKLEEMVMRELGLESAPASSQVVQRDRHAVLMFTLAVLGGTLEKIAVTLRGLQRTEIGEVMEGFAEGQKGSSAMPHKRNPITLERIAGLARLLRGNAIAAGENQALWDERDISHSSVERVIFADSLTIADYILDKMAGVLKRLVIDDKKMEENIRLNKGVYFSQTVLLRLIDKGLLREKAYEIVQRNAMKTHMEGTPFYDNLLKDDKLMDVLSREELAECFSNRHFSRNTDYILYRVGILDAPPSEESASASKAQPAKPAGRDQRRRPSRSSSRSQAAKAKAQQAEQEAVKPAVEDAKQEQVDDRKSRSATPSTSKQKAAPVHDDPEPPALKNDSKPAPQPVPAPPPAQIVRRVVETRAYEEHKRNLQSQQPPRYLSNNHPYYENGRRNEEADDEEQVVDPRSLPNYDGDAITDEPIVRATDADRRAASSRTRNQQGRGQRRGRTTGQSSGQPRKPRSQSPSQPKPPSQSQPRVYDEDAQPPQIEDWRSSGTTRRVVDSNFRGITDSRSRKKR